MGRCTTSITTDLNDDLVIFPCSTSTVDIRSFPLGRGRGRVMKMVRCRGRRHIMFVRKKRVQRRLTTVTPEGWLTNISCRTTTLFNSSRRVVSSQQEGVRRWRPYPVLLMTDSRGRDVCCTGTTCPVG